MVAASGTGRASGTAGLPHRDAFQTTHLTASYDKVLQEVAAIISGYDRAARAYNSNGRRDSDRIIYVTSLYYSKILFPSLIIIISLYYYC
jgi:hypothetical protein